MTATFPLPPDEATVAAYLGNQLAEPQADAFEIYCLNHPEFARKVELDLGIKRGLREIGMSDVKARPAIRIRSSWAMAAGLAAVMGCGLLLAWSHLHNSLVAYRTPSEVPLQLQAGVHFGVTLLRVRGSGPTHRIVVPRRNGVLELKIFPDTIPGPQGYSADIVLDSHISPRSLVVNQLHTDTEGYLNLYLPLSEVADHTLNINLSSDADRSAAPAPAFQLQVIATAE